MHLNIQSINGKYYDLLNTIESNKCDIMCLSETYLKADQSLPNNASYNVYRTDRSFEQSLKKSGGGVAIFTSNLLTTCQYKLECEDIVMATSFIEIVAVRVKVGNYKGFIVLSLYRPPKYKLETIQNDMNAIDMICEELNKTGKSFFLLGDFNLRDKWAYSKLEHILLKNKLKQLIVEPTRGNNILDLLVTNANHLCTNSKPIC